MGYGAFLLPVMVEGACGSDGIDASQVFVTMCACFFSVIWYSPWRPVSGICRTGARCGCLLLSVDRMLAYKKGVHDRV